MLHWLFKFWQKFNKAAEVIRNFSSGPTEDEFKEVYALYKQSTVGDVNTRKRSSFWNYFKM